MEETDPAAWVDTLLAKTEQPDNQSMATIINSSEKLYLVSDGSLYEINGGTHRCWLPTILFCRKSTGQHHG